MAELGLAPWDRASAAAIGQAVLEGKILGPVIGTTVESAQEISLAAIAPAVGQVPAALVREPARCRRAGPVAQTASVIGLSHQAPDSVRVAMLLVALDLTETPRDQQVTAEVPAWEVVEEVRALEEVPVVAVAGVEDNRMDEEGE